MFSMQELDVLLTPLSILETGNITQECKPLTTQDLVSPAKGPEVFLHHMKTFSCVIDAE